MKKKKRREKGDYRGFHDKNDKMPKSLETAVLFARLVITDHFLNLKNASGFYITKIRWFLFVGD